MSVVHYIAARRVNPQVEGGIEPVPACGRSGQSTLRPLAVTCRSCMRTRAYRAANPSPARQRIRVR